MTSSIASSLATWNCCFTRVRMCSRRTYESVSRAAEGCSEWRPPESDGSDSDHAVDWASRRSSSYRRFSSSHLFVRWRYLHHL